MEELQVPKDSKESKESIISSEHTHKEQSSKTQESVNQSDTKNDKYQIIKDLKVILAVCETILAIPVLGGIIVISTLWIPLFVMIGMHIGVIIYTSQNRQFGFSNTNHILGAIFNVLGFIPIVGMILHIILAILLWIEYNSIVEQEKQQQ